MQPRLTKVSVNKAPPPPPPVSNMGYKIGGRKFALPRNLIYLEAAL